MTEFSCRAGSCPCVDIHTHVVPPELPAAKGANPELRWPRIDVVDACHRSVVIAGKNFRTVGSNAWDAVVRERESSEQGVDVQVLSPMPELLSYWLPDSDAAQLCRYMNLWIAALVQENPAKFRGLGAVPMQSVDLAIEELEFLVRELGLSGVELGTNVNGVPLGHSSFLPFFEAASALGASIFVHPLHAAGKNMLVGPGSLEQLVAFPTETGLSTASLITSGLLAKLPHLRIAISHGGGALAAIVPRLQHAWESFDEFRDQLPLAPLAAARKLYYDSLVYDASTLRHLVGMFGFTQICVGSDFPFRIGDRKPVERLMGSGLSDDEVAHIRGLNAHRWLGLHNAS